MKPRARSDHMHFYEGGHDLLLGDRYAEVLTQPYDCDAPELEARAMSFLRLADAPFTAGFLFSKDDLDPARVEKTYISSALHDDIARAQALILARHVTTLHNVLAIDDIYAHPLIRRRDILSGHRLRAFAAAPIRCANNQLISVICTADTTIRRWTARDIRILQRIVAQFEERCLS